MQIRRFRSILQKVIKDSPTDLFLLRWGTLSLATLLITIAVEIYGLFEACGHQLRSVLSSPPFYCDLASQEPLLNKTELFCLHVLIVFYATCVALREQSRSRALTWLLLMMTATALLPFTLALWGLFLNTSSPVFSLIILGILRLCFPFSRSTHETA